MIGHALDTRAQSGEVQMPGSRRPRRRKSLPTPLDKLDPSRARTVLDRLLQAHPELRREAERLALSFLMSVTFEDVARDVEDTVAAVDADDLFARAGRHEWGYVEPDEAAWQALDEELEPFFVDMQRLLELSLQEAALETCKGLVLGLYRIEQEAKLAAAEWAPDYPPETACRAIATCAVASGGSARRRGRKVPPSLDEFIRQHVPTWRDVIHRAWSE